MYKRITITELGLIDSPNTGKPDNWIDIALTEEQEKDFLLVDDGFQFTGEHFDECREIIESIYRINRTFEPEPNEERMLGKCSKLGEDFPHLTIKQAIDLFKLDNETSLLPYEIDDILSVYKIVYRNYQAYEIHGSVQREWATIYCGFDIEPDLKNDIENYYFGYINGYIYNQGLEDEERFEIPAHRVMYADDFKKWLGLPDEYECVPYNESGYCIDELKGVKAISNAIRCYIDTKDYMDTEEKEHFSFDSLLYELKECDFLFDIEGNLK